MNTQDKLRQIALKVSNTADQRHGGLLLLRLYATLKLMETGLAPNLDLAEYRFIMKPVFKREVIFSDSDSKLISSVKIDDLIRFCLYDVISDYDALMKFRAAFPMDDWHLLSEVFICSYIHFQIDSGKYLNEQSRLTIYQSMQHDKDLILDDSKFNALYSAVNTNLLSREWFRFPSKMKSAIDFLLIGGMKNSDILELISSLYSSSPNFNRINEIMDIYEIPASERKNLIRSIGSGTDGVITPFSIWRYKEKNDVPVENSLLYNLFYSRMDMSASCRALIFFPSSFFLKKIYLDDFARNIESIFIFPNSTIASAYEQSFHNRNFRFSTYKSFIKEIATTSEGISYDQILVFGNNLQRGIRNDLFQKINQGMNRRSARLLLYANSDEFESADSEMSRLLQTAISADHLIILPNGIQNATEPKRKLILDGRIGGTHTLLKSKITYMKLDKTGREQGLSPHYIIDRMCLSDLQKEGRTLRNLYRQYVNSKYKKTDSTRTRAESYRFSDELVFYASSRSTKMGYRIEAYAYPPDYEDEVRLGIEADSTEEIEQINVNKRIEDSVKRTTKSEYTEQDKERWVLEIYPYEKIRDRRSQAESMANMKLKPCRTVRDAIIDSYRDTLGKTISIKTYVYFRPEMEDNLTLEEISLLRKLAASEIGRQHFPIEDDYIRTIYKEMYDAVSEQKSKEEISARSLLRMVFDRAVKEGYTSTNPFSEELAGNHTERSEDLLFTQVRKSPLIKRYFEMQEIFSIYQKCRHELKRGNYVYLGILIKLFLGLESNVVSGLIWDDFVKLDEAESAGEEVYQLLIRRQAVNDGSGYRPFSRKESYRALCLPDILAEILKHEHERLLGIFSESQLSEKPIVDSKDGNDITKTICSPIRIQKTCRSLVRGLKLDESIINVPTNNDGTKETNINDYHGDIFRSNYEHYARIVAKFNAGELAYMLGVKTEITFSNNYCDYGNSVSQIILYRKQSRWNSIFLSEKDSGVIQLQDGDAGRNRYVETSSYLGVPVMLTGNIEYDGSNLRIDIESAYGYDLMIGKIGIKE